MTALREYAITKLSTANRVDMKTGASTALYTVPAGKVLVISRVVVRSQTASLAGGTSYAVTGWRTGMSLTSMTTTTVLRELITLDNTDITPVAANAVCYWVVTTGSTAACTATIDLFGYLV